jgi:hypothetical protein
MERLEQYIARSPRFILSPEDNTLIRLSGPQRTPWEEPTEIRDFSISGLSFTAPTELSPKISETIKIQFSPPGQKEMACFAKVIRIEPFSEGLQLIGVEFFELNPMQRFFVARGVAYKMVDEWQQLRQNSPFKFFLKWVFYRFSHNKKWTLVLALVIVLWLILLFYLILSL